MDRSGMDRVGSRDRTRSVPLPRVRRSELGRAEVQFRFRHRARRGNGQRHHQRARSEPEAVHRSRRQADSVSRLERPADLAAQAARSTTRACCEALGGADKVHGSYRLFMAPGMGHCGGGEGPNTFDMVTALEQWVEQRQGARSDSRVALDRWQHRSHAALVSVSAGRSYKEPAAPTKPQTSRVRHQRVRSQSSRLAQSRGIFRDRRFTMYIRDER